MHISGDTASESHSAPLPYTAPGQRHQHDNAECAEMRQETHPQISTTVPLGEPSESLDILLRRGPLTDAPPLPPLRHNAQNLLPRLKTRQREIELPIEPARPPQSGIDRVRPIGRTDHDDLATPVHAVHEREQRRHDRCVDLVLFGGADGREAVYFVEEDDRGLGVAGFFEEETELAFGLAYPFGEAVCAFAHEKGCI